MPKDKSKDKQAKRDMLLTAQEVADRLRINRQTAVKYLREGIIPGGLMIGEGGNEKAGAWRLPESALEAYLTTRQRMVVEQFQQTYEQMKLQEQSDKSDTADEKKQE